jgi:hypothetical protein
MKNAAAPTIRIAINTSIRVCEGWAVVSLVVNVGIRELVVCVKLSVGWLRDVETTYTCEALVVRVTSVVAGGEYGATLTTNCHDDEAATWPFTAMMMYA